MKITDLITQSIDRLTSKPEQGYKQCKRCGDPLVDLLTEQRDTWLEKPGKCNDCLIGKKKICDCGKWHTLKNTECFDCFIEKRRKNSEFTK